MEDRIFYLVIGGPYRYHAEDDEFTEIYGLFSDYETACQCLYYHKSHEGSVIVIPIPVDKFFDQMYIGLSGEENPPKPKLKLDIYTEIYIVRNEEFIFGVYKTKQKADSLLDKLLDGCPDKYSYFDVLNPLRTLKYIKLDLQNIEPDISGLIDIDIQEPVRIEKIPPFYRF